MLQEYDCTGPLIDDTFLIKLSGLFDKVDDLRNLGQTNIKCVFRLPASTDV